MKIVWVTRSFLDYRIPVYKALKSLNNNDFILIFNEDYVPDSVVEKAKKELGESCIGLKGELTLGNKDTTNKWANKGFRIPIQKGLIKTIKKEQPDVIISDGFFQWTYAALWMRFFHGVKHVMCYERTKHTERHAQWYRTLYRKIVSKWIDAICCSGKLCGHYLETLGFSLKNVTYGHMVGDVEKFQQPVIDRRHRLLVEDNTTLKYIYVGRIVDAKGIDALLEAWHKFQDSKNVALYLVGDGPNKDKYEAKRLDLKLDTVHFLGRIDYDKLPNYYQSADIFVIPTLEDNWSLVVPEAMASGLPILSSVYNGCYPEYITEKNGWVFDPLDSSDFVNKLETSFNCDNLKEMGENSKKIISNCTPLHAAKVVINAIEIAVKTK